MRLVTVDCCSQSLVNICCFFFRCFSPWHLVFSIQCNNITSWWQQENIFGKKLTHPYLLGKIIWAILTNHIFPDGLVVKNKERKKVGEKPPTNETQFSVADFRCYWKTPMKHCPWDLAGMKDVGNTWYVLSVKRIYHHFKFRHLFWCLSKLYTYTFRISGTIWTHP